jgi:hypothetical protein
MKDSTNKYMVLNNNGEHEYDIIVKETKKGVVNYNSEITESPYEQYEYSLSWDNSVNTNNVLPYLDF